MNEKSGRVTSFVPFLEGVREQRGECGADDRSLVIGDLPPLKAIRRRLRRDVGPAAVRIVQVLERGPRPVTDLASEAGLSTPEFIPAFQELLEAGAIRLKGAPGREDAELTNLAEPSHA